MPDIPARRRAPPGWTRPITERLTPVIKGLILTMAVLYAVYVFIRESRPLIEAYLAVGPGLFHGMVWQPVTSLFTHTNVLQVFFDVLCIWFTGAQLEKIQGTRRFLTMFFVAGVLSNLAIAGLSRVQMAGIEMPASYTEGSALAVLAMFVAVGRIFDRTPTQILGGLFVQSRHMAMGFVGLFLLQDLLSHSWPRLAGTIVAVVVGFFGAAPGGWNAIRTRFKTGRARRRYRVIEGGNRPSKKYLN